MATLKFKRSATPAKAPTIADIDLGEIAMNTFDGKLYMKKDDGTQSIVQIGAGGSGSGTVTSVAATVPSGFTVSGSPITTSGTLAIAFASGYSLPTTTSQANWDTAYSDRLKWDGGSTGLVAATGRTSLGATTLGSNLFTITNPSAITFPRFNADNSISALDAATFRTAIGAGAGSVTSVDASGGTTGLTFSGGPVTGTGTLTLTGTLAVANGGTGSTTASAARTALGATTLGGNLFTITNPSAITFPRFNADNTVSALDAATYRTAIGAGTGNGTVTSVNATVPTGLTVSGGPVTTTGTLAISFSAGYSIPTTTSQTNWDSAYTDRMKWDGGATGLVAATGRTSLGLVIGTDVQAYSATLTTWAGKTAPSGTVVGTTDTQTLTNKRVTARVNAQTTTASPWAWNSDSYDQQSFSALANALTINADAGTPTDGQKAMFRFKDNGTARALTWTTGTTNSFRAIGVTLPTTTVISKTVYVGCVYSAADSRWDAVAVAQEA